MLAEDEVHAREVDPETRLWRLVISQALQDALGKQSTDSYARRNRHLQPDAIRWFKDAGRDFRTVCTMADLEPAAVQSAALRMIEKAEAA